MRNVDLFTASGTWTCPANVTYAVAHIRAGGGGGGGTFNGAAATGGVGGSSSAFSTTASGGSGGGRTGINASNRLVGSPAPANSGEGGGGAGNDGYYSSGVGAMCGSKGSYLVKGLAVTPGTSYTITVGAGGAGGAAGSSGGQAGGAGGSGAVWIEYEVPA